MSVERIKKAMIILIATCACLITVQTPAWANNPISYKCIITDTSFCNYYLQGGDEVEVANYGSGSATVFFSGLEPSEIKVYEKEEANFSEHPSEKINIEKRERIVKQIYYNDDKLYKNNGGTVVVTVRY
ncbi:hypothetical protein [Moorena sp. SIO3B2]|uniref:hypothetical protein n=1 Tax=Moorena sp. SIO3B2 TaxID=2607827 RepID=UPI0013CA1C39|nr:hypothetical protein [Moorena sp. SIO3B2]NEP32924.1 hypothetical protein [Moorena sp. SIO3B2]